MVRIGVSIYLMLATLAGPWLCCCTTARLLAAPAPRTDQPLPLSPVRKGCCCHCGNTTPENEPASPAPQKPASPSHPCPCQQGRSDAALLPTPELQAAQGPLAGHLSQALPGPAATLADVLLPGGGHCTLGTSHDLPFVTAQDVLYTLHILRC